MAKAGLSFSSPTLTAMDIEPLGNPYDPTPDIGLGNLTGKRQSLEQGTKEAFGEAMSQFTFPDLKAPQLTGPNVLYSPSTKQLFVNGSLFSEDDADAAIQSETFLDGPRQETPVDSAGDWRRLSPEEYGTYMRGIKDPTIGRVWNKNFETGVATGKDFIGSLGILAGADPTEGWAADLRAEAAETQRKNSPYTYEFTDVVEGEDDLVNWFVGSVASTTPIILETIIGTAAAALFGTTVGASATLAGAGAAIAGLTGKAAFKKSVKEAAEAYVKEKAKGKDAAKAFLKSEQGKILKSASGIAAATTFNIANNSAIGTADIYGELLDNGVDPNDFGAKVTAIAGSIPYAAASMVPEFLLGAKLLGAVSAGSAGGITRRALTGAGVGGVLEGTSEAVQEGIVMGAGSAYGKDYSDEAIARLVNSFAAGFAVGAPIGGVANLKGRKEADLLKGNTEAAPPTPMAPDESGQMELFTEEETVSTDPLVGPRPVVPEDTTATQVAQRDELLDERRRLLDFIDRSEQEAARGYPEITPERYNNIRTQVEQARQALQTVDQSIADLGNLPPRAQATAERQQGQQALFGGAEESFTPVDPVPTVQTPPAPVSDVTSAVEQTAAQQPVQTQPNLLQQRMQEAAATNREQQIEQEKAAMESERAGQKAEELQRSLDLSVAERDIAESQGFGFDDTPIAPVEQVELPTVPMKVTPPRQLDLFRGKVKLQKPTKAEQRLINKANRFKRKQEREAAAQAAVEQQMQGTPAQQAQRAGQQVLFTQRGEPSVAALRAAGVTQPTTEPEVTQTTPVEEQAVAQQRQEAVAIQQAEPVVEEAKAEKIKKGTKAQDRKTDDNMSAAETKQFNPAQEPTLVDRRDQADIAESLPKGKSPISGGEREADITTPSTVARKFQNINYEDRRPVVNTAVLTEQVVQSYGAAIPNIQVHTGTGVEQSVRYLGAHHNGGVIVTERIIQNFGNRFSADAELLPRLLAHELGHAAHSRLGDMINKNKQVLAELPQVENYLYPELREEIVRAEAAGLSVDAEFFNYLLSPEELIAEFNVYRLSDPEARQVAPALSELLESAANADNLVIPRKVFPTGWRYIDPRTVKPTRGMTLADLGVQQDAVPERSATEMDAQEQPEVSETVRERDTQEREVTGTEETTDEGTTAPTGEVVVTTAPPPRDYGREETGVELDAEAETVSEVELDEDLDPESEEYEVAQLIKDFEEGSRVYDKELTALSLFDYAFFSGSDTDPDFVAARARAKAFVMSVGKFSEGEYKILDKVFFKMATQENSRSSTQAWYDYAAKRNLYTALDDVMRITGAPHQELMKSGKPARARTAVEEKLDNDQPPTKTTRQANSERLETYLNAALRGEAITNITGPKSNAVKEINEMFSKADPEHIMARGTQLKEYFDNGALKIIQVDAGQWIPTVQKPDAQRQAEVLQTSTENRKKAKDVLRKQAREEAEQAARERRLTGERPTSDIDPFEATDQDEGNFYRFDGKPIDRTVPKLKIATIAKQITGKLKVKPTITVVSNREELRTKFPELFDRAAAARPNGDFETTNAVGYSVGDQVIIFSDFARTEEQVKFVIAHETLGHFGFRSIMDNAELSKAMGAAYEADTHLQAVVDRNIEMGMDRNEAIEEALADQAAYLETSTLARVWNFVKEALNRIFGIQLQDDMARYIVNQSRRNLLQGDSGVVSATQLRSNIESLASANELGRYSRDDGDVSNAASVSLALQGNNQRSGPAGGFRGVAEVVKKAATLDNWNDTKTWIGEVLENVQSLDNLASRSLGLQEIFHIFQSRANRARRYLSKYEHMTKFSHSFTPSREELNQAGQLLAYGALHKQRQVSEQSVRDIPDLVRMERGHVRVDREAFERAQALGELSREDFTNGILVEIGDPDAGTYESKVWKPEFEINDTVWKIYEEQRAAVNQSAVDVLQSTIEGAIAQREETISGFKNTYRGKTGARLTDSDTYVLRLVMDQYIKLYQEGAVREGGTLTYKRESMDKAKLFLREINRAMYIPDKVEDWKQGRAGEGAAEFQGAEYQEIIAGLESISNKELQKGSADRITSAIGNLYLLEVQASNAQYQAKRTISTSYVPFTRRGNWQITVKAYDENGNAVKLDENWKSVMPFFQAENRADAREIENEITTAYGDTEFTITDADGAERTVTFRAATAKSRQGTVLGQQFSLNDFVNTLTRLDVNINPTERENIIKALTKQSEKARRSLERTGTAGWDQDVVRSTSEYLEMQGHVAGQVFYRHRMNNIMLNDSMWRGDAKLLNDLYKAATETEGKTPEQIRKAQNDYDKYAYMYQFMADSSDPQATNRKTGEKMNNIGRGEDYRATALKLQQWYADTANINDSTEDLLSGETGSQLKMWTVISQLGGSVASAGINLFSLGTHAIPFLGTYNEARGFGGGFGMANAAREIQRAARNLWKANLADATEYDKIIANTNPLKKYGITRDEALFLQSATEEGVLQSAQANALIGTARGGIHSNKLQKGIQAWMFMFSYTEQLNRRATALAAYRLYINRAKAGSPEFESLPQQQKDALMEQWTQEASDFARNAVNTSQGEYGMFNRPEMARGNLGQYIFIYKQFQIITVQMMKGMDTKGRLAFLGMLFIMSGLKGIPFADDLMDLIDTLAQTFGIKMSSIEEYVATLSNEMIPGSSPILLRGVVDQFTAGTFSTRLGMGDMLPLTEAFLAGADTGRSITNFLGPIWSGLEGATALVGNTAKYGAQVAGFRDDTMSFTSILRDQPVSAIRALADAYTYYDSGAVVNGQGKVIDPSASVGQIVWRALGFYPAEATRQNDIVRIGKRHAAYVKDLKSSYTNAYVKAIIEGDIDREIEVLQMVDDWNLINAGTRWEFRNFERTAKRAADAALMPTAKRYLKTAPVNLRPDLEILMEIYGVEADEISALVQ